MNLSFNFIQGLFQLRQTSPATPVTTQTPLPSPTPNSLTVTTLPLATSTPSAQALTQSARPFATSPLTSSRPVLENPTPVPWPTTHESPWLNPLLRMGQNISGLDFDVEGVLSNAGEAGCRYSEFRYDGTASFNGASVCWEANTRADIHIGVRMNRFTNPALPPEPVITEFRARYIDERQTHLEARSPLNVSGRSPVAAGPSILNLRGFHGHLAGIPIPNRSDYDPMYPPTTLLSDTTNVCSELNTCLWTLRYSFNGAVEAIARESQASYIDSFWESLGFNFREFYRMSGLPRDTIDMRSRLFIERIVRPFFTQEGRDYLTTYARTWSPNPDGLFSGDFQALAAHFQNRPDTYIFPNSSRLTLHQPSPIQNLISNIAQNPVTAFGIREHPSLDSNETRSFFQTLGAAYQDGHRLNEIEFRSQEVATPAHDRQAARSVGTNFQIHTPALSYNWVSREEPNHFISFANFLARNIEVTGPSVMHIVQNLLSGNWNDNTPIHIHLDHPYFSNLAIKLGIVEVELPHVWADSLDITLPSLAQLGRILQVGPNTEINGALFSQHLAEVLQQVQVRASNLKIAGNFNITYQQSELGLRGYGAEIGVLDLRSLVSPPTMEGITPTRVAPAEAFSSNNAELAHLLAILPDFLNPARPESPIPLLYISNARLHYVVGSFRGLGSLVANGNHLENFRVYFPDDQLAVSATSLRSEGQFSYNSNPDITPPQIQNAAATPAARAAASTNSPAVPQRTQFNLSGNSHLENLNLIFDIRRPGVTHARFRTRLTGSIEPGSIAYPSGNIRVQFGEGSHIDNVDLNGDIRFPRENSSQPFEYNVTYAGNMNLNLSQDEGVNSSSPPVAFTYGTPGSTPYIELKQVSGASQNACIYASNRQIFISNQANFPGACNLENGNPNISFPALRQRPPVADESPIDVQVGIQNVHWNLDFNGFHFDHQGSATLNAGLNYFLLNTDENNRTSLAVDIRQPHVRSLLGTLSARHNGNEYHSTSNEVSPQNPNHLGAERVYFAGSSRNSQFNLRELLVEGLQASVESGTRHTPGYSLIRFALPGYELFNPTGRPRGLVSYPTLSGPNGSRFLFEAIYPNLPTIQIGPRSQFQNR